MRRTPVQVSKFLSFVLRHHPEQIGLHLDDSGWAHVDELLLRANQAGVPLTRDLLQTVVDTNDKKRFALSEDGQRIRASQGHSIPVDLGLQPVSPPELLYHGTGRQFVTSIQREGLTARQRNHVHLSGDPVTALAVGRRHGKPAVLTIQARRMQKDGYLFYHSANDVWLTQTVPPTYILLSPEPPSGA